MENKTYVLHSAILDNDAENARKHILADADVNEFSRGDFSPLHLCAQHGNVTIAKWLTNAGARVNAKNEKGVTPLHSCSWSNAIQIAELLIRHGANVNAKDKLQWTPLMLAAWSNHDNLIDLYIHHGALINARNCNGSNALHLAAYNGCSLAVARLLDYKANVNMQNNDGMTPIDVAIRRNHKDCEEVLRKSKSRPHATAEVVATPVQIDEKDYAGTPADEVPAKETTPPTAPAPAPAAVAKETTPPAAAPVAAVKEATPPVASVAVAKETTPPAIITPAAVRPSMPPMAPAPTAPPTPPTPPPTPTAAVVKPAHPPAHPPATPSVAKPAVPPASLTKPAVKPHELQDPYYRDIYYLLDKPEKDMPFLTELTKEQAKLSSDGNQSPPIFPDQLINITLAGEKVRRKSEVVIANLLYSLDLNYIYERKLCGTVSVGINYPAFTIFCPDDSIVVWEHVSALETVEKKNQFTLLKRWYSQNGFVEGQSFFVTQDSPQGGVDSHQIWNVAEKVNNVVQSIGTQLAGAEDKGK